MKLYRCSRCGSMVVKMNKGGCTPVCCGEEMVELTANTTDAAVEKHVPAVTVEENHIKVTVGDVAHPMIDAHYIEWVALESEKGWQIKYLHPSEEPKTCFVICKHDKPVAVYAYCNLHGLWKKELD